MRHDARHQPVLRVGVHSLQRHESTNTSRRQSSSPLLKKQLLGCELAERKH